LMTRLRRWYQVLNGAPVPTEALDNPHSPER